MAISSKMYILCAFNLLWLYTSVVAADLSTVVVETPVGKLRGVEATARNGQSFYSFTGIPYAKPPVGRLRFAKPEPHPPFDGIFDATKQATYCPHPDALLFLKDMPAGKEDCLVLNVYIKQLALADPQAESAASESTATRTTTTPATHSRKPMSTGSEVKKKKKVVVWIHGGGFTAGGATDYPAGTFVTTQDVIVVAVNYRLGILGFLSTEDSAAPGNYGLWDQVMALRWVKDNIAAFGGDPDDVTLAGESAGGAAVALLSVAPSARDLFTKVFPMSGTGTSIFAIARDAQEATLEVARATGCLKGENTDITRRLALEESQAIMSCLRDAPLGEFTKLAPFTLEKAWFVPRVDGDLVPLHPSALLKNDHYLESVGFFNRTYMFSVVNNEKAIMQAALDAIEEGLKSNEVMSEEEKKEKISKLHNDTFEFYLTSRLNTASPSNALKSKVRDWYSRRLSEPPTSSLVADLTFIIPTYDYLNTVARCKNTDAYFVYFNHYPGFMHGKNRGIVHAADLLYWFDIDLNKWEKMIRAGLRGEMDLEDLKLKVMFSDMVGQFIKTGNPWNGLQEELPDGWPTFDFRGNHYLDFCPKPVVRRHLDRAKRDLWLVSVPAWAASSAP